MRRLRADEIEVRAKQVITNKEGKPAGVMALLYKNARCDMNLLDEEYGPERWQRKHELINGNLFCSVGVRFDEGWVWKQDVGTESNTEAEKGQASDSFKRACVLWGAGRELYTAPRIVIWDAKIVNGKCYDRWYVSSIGYDDSGRINALEIANEETGKIVYKYPKEKKKPQAGPDEKQMEYADAKLTVLKYVSRHNLDADKIAKWFKAENINEMQTKDYKDYIAYIEKNGGNINE